MLNATTAEPNIKEIPTEKIKHYCSIRFEITRTVRTGKRNHRKVKSSGTYRTVDSALPVQEDSKPVFIGVVTG